MMVVSDAEVRAIIMRADSKGEAAAWCTAGADFAQQWQSQALDAGIVLLGVFATALFYGGPVVTPAVSRNALGGGRARRRRAGIRRLVLPIAVVV